MPRLKWRRITVANTVYRWTVSDPSINAERDVFKRMILIRLDAHPQSLCSFVSQEVGYRWWGRNEHPLPVTPKLVADCIRYALDHGWEPEKSKADQSFTLGSDLLASLDNITPS